MRQWLLKLGGTTRVGRRVRASSSSPQEQSGEGTTEDRLESFAPCFDAVEDTGVEDEDAVDILYVKRVSVAKVPASVVLAICRAFRRVEEHFNLLAPIAMVNRWGKFTVGRRVWCWCVWWVTSLVA